MYEKKRKVKSENISSSDMIIEMRSRVWRWLVVGCGLLAAVNAFVVTPTYPKYSKGIYGTVINDVDLLTTADLKISTRSSESLQPHTDQDTTTSNTEMRPNQHPTEFISNELYTMQEVVTTSTTTSDKTAYDLAVMLLSALLYLPSLDFLERYSFSLLTHDRVEEVTNLVVDAHFIPQDYHKWTSFPSPNLPVVKQVVDKVKRINKAIIDKNNALNKYKLQQKVHSSMTTRNLFRLHFPSLTLSKESLCVVVEDTSILINDKAKIVGVVELYPLSPVYLCNLSIDKSYRRSGLAYVLCQLMEIIVQTCWNESEVSKTPPFLLLI